MKHISAIIFSLFGLALIASLSSCQPTFQYDVLVENKTDEILRIAFKTSADRQGPIEDVLLLKPSEIRRIISTTNLDTKDDKLGTNADHCKLVAEYVSASKSDGTKSKKSWCDKDIRFEKVDVQQAEFTLVYTNDDF